MPWSYALLRIGRAMVSSRHQAIQFASPKDMAPRIGLEMRSPEVPSWTYVALVTIAEVIFLRWEEDKKADGSIKVGRVSGWMVGMDGFVAILVENREFIYPDLDKRESLHLPGVMYMYGTSIPNPSILKLGHIPYPLIPGTPVIFPTHQYRKLRSEPLPTNPDISRVQSHYRPLIPIFPELSHTTIHQSWNSGHIPTH